MYGGRGSQYVGDFYAQTAVGGPRAISYATLQYIDNSPMFNPLADNTVMPTTTSGVIPTGLYLANVPNERLVQSVNQEGAGSIYVPTKQGCTTNAQCQSVPGGQHNMCWNGQCVENQGGGSTNMTKKKLLEMVSTEKLMKMANKYGVFPEAMERDELISAIRMAKQAKHHKKYMSDHQDQSQMLHAETDQEVYGNVASMNTIK